MEQNYIVHVKKQIERAEEEEENWAAAKKKKKKINYKAQGFSDSVTVWKGVKNFRRA